MKLSIPNFSIPDILKRDWWLKIKTREPKCTYYFGPFKTKDEAKHLQFDYITDLQHENAKGLTVEFTQKTPEKLTVWEDE